MFFPVLGFFDQGFYTYSLVADHWQYYSIIGIIALMVAAGVTLCRETGSLRRRIGTVTGAVVLVALGASTWIRASVYGDAETLWRDTLAKNPNAWLAHNNLGDALVQAGRVQEAIGHYEQALRIKPDYAEAHYNLGIALVQAGRLQEAIGHYEQALRDQARLRRGAQQPGDCLDAGGQDAGGDRALRAGTADQARLCRGALQSGDCALAGLGRVQEAIGHYEQALRIKPDYAEAHNNLGSPWRNWARCRRRSGTTSRRCGSSPIMPKSHYNLGKALAQVGRVPEAIGQYEQALRIKPDFAEAQNNLGIALIRGLGKVQEAIGGIGEQAIRAEFPKIVPSGA